MARTAAALIIGNEILTGKIADQNIPFLARELFELGVSLRRVIVCPDEVDVIARDLSALREAHDVVFTSGGVGPTHDDVTLEAVAKALGRRVVRSGEIELMIRNHFGDRTTEGHLRMADVPEGATLVRNAEMPWPVVIVDDVYVFPGVPEIFRLKFPVLRDRLRADAPFASRALYTQCDEFEIAEALASVATRARLQGEAHLRRARRGRRGAGVRRDGRRHPARQARPDGVVRAGWGVGGFRWW